MDPLEYVQICLHYRLQSPKASICHYGQYHRSLPYVFRCGYWLNSYRASMASLNRAVIPQTQYAGTVEDELFSSHEAPLFPFIVRNLMLARKEGLLQLQSIHIQLFHDIQHHAQTLHETVHSDTEHTIGRCFILCPQYSLAFAVIVPVNAIGGGCRRIIVRRSQRD